MLELTSRNVIFNRSSFRDFETTIGFLASKRVQKWSQILISSPGWPCTQNETRLNWQFTNCLEKCDFLQTNPNIGILYTHGNHFSPRLTIRDRCLKIRVRLARINRQSFANLYRNVCQQSGHFRREWRAPLQRGAREGLVGTLKWQWAWLETAFCRRSPRGLPRTVDHHRGWHTGRWEAAFPLFGTSRSSSTSTCSSTVAALLRSSMAAMDEREALRDRRRERKRDRE